MGRDKAGTESWLKASSVPNPECNGRLKSRSGHGGSAATAIILMVTWELGGDAGDSP